MNNGFELLKLTSKTMSVDDDLKEIKVLSLGHISSQKGDFVVDNESFRNMESFFEARGIDIVIDYEHQTLKDVQAPAAGWVKRLFLKQDGIYANVEWTSKAKEYLKNKEYRYISPVVLVRKNDKKAVILNSIALTNLPAINGIEAIVNSGKDCFMDNMDKNEINLNDLKEIAKALGLEDSATKEEIIKSINDLKSKCNADTGKKKAEESKEDNNIVNFDKSKEESEIVTNSYKNFYKLQEANNIVEIALKTGIINENQKDFAFSQCMMEDSGFKQFIQSNYEKECDKVVLKALQKGKIAPYQKKWAETYAHKDLNGFTEFVEKSIPVIPVGEFKYLKDDVDNYNGNSAEDNISKMLNVSQEDLKKYNR